LPAEVTAKLEKAGLTANRPHTWANLASSREDVVTVAFELNVDLAEQDFRFFIDVLWDIIQAAKPIDDAKRASRLSRDSVE
jgi:hypothetical protein